MRREPSFYRRIEEDWEKTYKGKGTDGDEFIPSKLIRLQLIHFALSETET